MTQNSFLFYNLSTYY